MLEHADLWGKTGGRGFSFQASVDMNPFSTGRELRLASHAPGDTGRVSLPRRECTTEYTEDTEEKGVGSISNAA